MNPIASRLQSIGFTVAEHGLPKTRAFMRQGCPFCTKFLLFLDSAHIQHKFQIEDATAEVSSMIEKATGRKPAYPCVQLENGKYMFETQDLIDMYRKQYDIDITRPDFNGYHFYCNGIFLNYKRFFGHLGRETALKLIGAPPSKITAITYDKYGNSDVLKLSELNMPKVGPKDVLIKAHFAGINPVDFKIRQGYLKNMFKTTMPIVPGWDVAGIVVEAGDQCTRLKKGDAVFSYTRPASDMGHENEAIDVNGCCAEYIAVPEWKVAKKSNSVPFDAAAAVPLAGLTAWQGIFDHGELKAGGTLLVLNASGGVGSFAVQFAKAKDATSGANTTVIGTCSGRNVEAVKSLGADHVIDYTKGPVAEQIKELGLSIDVVFDCVGGDDTVQGAKAVKEGGIVVSIANTMGVGKICEEAGKDKTGKGFFVKPGYENLDSIMELLNNGDVKLPKLEVMALADCASAHDLSETHRITGKLVLDVTKK